MNEILNFVGQVCAHLTIPTMILLSVIFFLRVIAKKLKKGSLVHRINRWLRKVHIPLSIFLIACVLIHAACLGEGIFSLNFGWVPFCLILLLGATYYFRKKIKKPNWLFWHRLLSILFVLTMLIHIAIVSEEEDTVSKQQLGQSYSITKILEATN